LVYVGILIALLIIGYLVYTWVRSLYGKSVPSLFGGVTGSADQAPTAIDGKERTVIGASSAPIGTGSDYGLQFWMYIKDWDYKFGSIKNVVKRVGANNAAISNPNVSLNPTDNSLDVSVHYFGSASQGETATGSTNSSGDVFTCTVENVPLQSWFSVSVTMFDRNMDIYINGRLVKSCVIPGVPKPAIGDIILNDNGGFSGSICNLRTFTGMLSPSDAQAFFGAGTTCGATAMAQADDSIFAKIFGYSFKFSIFNDKGSEVNQYTF
jgi:hypothetical protein